MVSNVTTVTKGHSSEGEPTMGLVCYTAVFSDDTKNGCKRKRISGPCLDNASGFAG